MATKQRVVLTKLANDQITFLFQHLENQDALEEAEALMNDFLDTVFGEIAAFPERFPVIKGLKQGSAEYRIGNLVGDFRVIFQIMRDRVLILLILHESELPF